jgi:iron complex outermembrane receptor protein
LTNFNTLKYQKSTGWHDPTCPGLGASTLTGADRKPSVIMQTPSKKVHLQRLAFAALFPLAGIVASFGQTAPAPAGTTANSNDEAIELPVFGVSADKVNKYAPGDALSAARIRASLSDLSTSISVISQDFMKDIGAESVLDASRYSSGMSAGRAAGVGGIADRHVIRGFESIDGRVVDNFQVGFQANFDPQFIERIEVVKGPNSILTPTGAPGGTINVVSKSPRFEKANSLTLAVGQTDAQKISLDSTGPLTLLNQKLAYRVVAGVQDTKSFLPGKVKLYDLEAGMTWKISPKSQLTFKYFGMDWTQKGAIGAANSWGVPVSYNLAGGAEIPDTPDPALGFTAHGANGDTDWSTRKVRVNMVTSEYTTALSDHISMRFAANWLSNKQGQDQGFQTVGGISSNRFNPFTGVATPRTTWSVTVDPVTKKPVIDPVTGQPIVTSTDSVPWDPTKISRRAAWIQSLSQVTQFQNDFAGNFKAGPVSIQPLAGWSTVSTINFPNYDRTAALPADNLFISDDDNPAKPEKSTYTTSFLRSSHNRQKQAYVYSRFGFLNDRLFITGGAARIWLDNVQYQWITNNAPTAAASQLTTLKDNHDTYLGGILGKPLPNVSVYYGYSSNAAGVTANGLTLWRAGKQHEWGVKTDFFKQRLSFTVAHFQIIQTNLSTPNPAFNADPVNNPPNILADFSNHGYEFELKGGITKNLSIVASYTSQRLRDPTNRRPRNIADRTTGALLNYHFTSGELNHLGVFLGMTRQGKTAGDTITGFTPLNVAQQTSFYVPPVMIFNTGATYPWKNTAFTLTVDNLADKKGFWQAADRGDVPPIPRRNVRLTATYTF